MKKLLQTFLLFSLGVFFVCFFLIAKVDAEDMTVNATVPAICGNSFEEGDEECDDGNVVSGDDCSDVCEEESSGGGGPGGGGPAGPVCRNGVKEGNEQCDDGNAVNSDFCSNACILAVCGDANLNGAEQCDDGNAVNTDFCNNLCRVPICGNSVKEGAEQCDDGNWLDGDGCSAACMNQDPIVCGDGLKQGAEQCDDHNVLDGDGCTSACRVEIVVVCGDSLVNGAEQCDDGNALSGDGCSNLCVLEVPSRCGNGELEGGEQCDDGNIIPGDSCSNLCQDEELAICGNGVKEWTEECDDGNFNDGDGCDNLCVFVPLPGTVCGNGIHEAGESCDDGNRRNGDGCTNMCQQELPDEAAGQNAGDIPVNPNVPVAAEGQNAAPAGNENMPAMNGLVPAADGGGLPQNSEDGGASEASGDVSNAEQPVFVSFLEGVDSGAPFSEQATQVWKNIQGNFHAATLLVKQQGQVAGQSLRQITDDPLVEQANEILVAPATVAVVAAAVVPSLGAVGMPFFHFLFLQPFLLFGRKKRKEWGQIYNSLTKLPVDLALVRLVNPKTKRVMQSRVTDTQGRYLFFVEPGEYILEITKPGFTFPSQILAQEKTDGKFLDLYHGEMLTVTDKKSSLTPNIPLDPLGATKTVRRIKKEKFFVGMQHTLSSAGIVVNAVSAYVSPKWYVFVLLGVQIVMYGLFVRLVKPKKPKGWGIVYTKNVKHPIESAVVRLFTKKYNKLVSTQVTDKKGRFAFLVGPSDYYVTFEKKGFVTKQSDDIVIPETHEAAILKPSISLEREVVIPKV